MDRRAAFFVAAAAVSAILIPVTEEEQRWVPVSLVVVYLLLAVGWVAVVALFGVAFALATRHCA